MTSKSLSGAQKVLLACKLCHCVMTKLFDDGGQKVSEWWQGLKDNEHSYNIVKNYIKS